MDRLTKASTKMSAKQLLLLGFTFAISVVLILYYSKTYLFSTELGHDEGFYVAMAKRLADTGIYAYNSEYSNAFVPPVFPLYLTLWYKLVGLELNGLVAIRCVQMIFTLLSFLLLFIFTVQLTKNYNIAIIATFFAVINLNFYSYTFAMLTENIYFLLMMLFCVLFYHAFESNNCYELFFSGFLFSITVFTRSAIVVVLPVLLIIIAFSSTTPPEKPNFKSLLFFLIGFIIVALPWWIRNFITLGEPVLFCTQDHIMYVGLADDIYKYNYTQPDSAFDNILLLFRILKEHTIETLYWFTAGKFSVLFLSHDNNINSTIAAICTGAVAYLGLPSLIKGLFSKKQRLWCVLFFIYLFSIFMGYPTNRYGLQFVYFLSIGAAVTLYKIFEQ